MTAGRRQFRGRFLFLFILGSLFLGQKSHASTIVTWGQTNNYGLGNIPVNLTNAVALAAGNAHSVALRADGKVTAWGSNSAGETNVPTNLSNVVAIAAAWQHTLALKSNGTVVAWGTGGINVPPGLSNVVAIAAGNNFGLALKANGTVVAWGDFSFGPTNVPSDLSNVVGITASSSSAVALKADGTVVTWGSPPLQTSAFTNIVAVAASEFPLVGLKANGTVVATSISTSISAPPANLSNVMAIAAGRYHAMALKDNGTVVTWGTTAVPSGLTNVQMIASGQGHLLALIADGRPFLTTPLLDRTVAPGSRVSFYALATGAARLSYQWKSHGTNLPGATNSILSLTNILPRDSGIYSLDVTNGLGSVSASAVLTVPDFSGPLNTTNLDWGTSGHAPWFPQTNVTHDGVSAMQSGLITNNQSTILETTITGPGTLTFWWKVSSRDGPLRFLVGNAQQDSIGGNVDWQQKTIYLGEGRQLLKWIFSKGPNANSDPYSGWIDQVNFIPGATAPMITLQPISQSHPAGFSAAFSATAIGTPPISYQWQFMGNNLPGAEGSSLLVTNIQSSNIGLYTLVVTNIGGRATTEAILEFGQVAVWGNNSYGEMNVPIGMTNVSAIAVGKLHTLALKSDGTVVGWGNRWTGPANLTNVIAISSSAGADYDLALKEDGTVVAWGKNTFGQTNVPPDLTNVVAIFAGWYHGLALKSDGRVVSWGLNWDGQTNVPSGLSNVVAIAGGSFHSLAVTDDGRVVAWGQSNVQTVVPMDLTNAVAVAGGHFYSTAIRSDGTVAAWGDNSQGQTNVPASLTNVISISAGWDHSLAVKADGSLAGGDLQTTVPEGLTNVLSAGVGLFHNAALLGNSAPVLAVPLADPNWQNAGFKLSFLAQSGRTYRLEYKDALTDARWTSLPLVAGKDSIVTLADPAATNNHRFYRVRQW